MPKILRPLPHVWPGTLIALEGIDGSGKSTQAELLSAALSAQGITVVRSNWYTADHIYNLMMSLNFQDRLGTEAAIILGAAELMARLEYVILPALELPGTVVIADKYVHAGLSHDIARNGVAWADLSRSAYAIAPPPNLIIYLDLPPRDALARKQTSSGLGYWESGSDYQLALPISESLRRFEEGKIPARRIEENFIRFQGRIRKVYAEILERNGAAAETILRLDGREAPDLVARKILNFVLPRLRSRGE